MSQVPDSYKPEEIADQPIPMLNGGFTQKTGFMSESDSITPPTIPDIIVPEGIVASDVIATSLNTSTRVIKGTYTFEQMGSIQVGTVSDGVLISPLGILGVHSGVTTFAIDTNGNAYFKGTVAAGSIVTGYIAVGGAAGDVNGNSTTIDGGKITANSVTATQISGSYVYAGTLNANQITAGNIDAARIQTNVLAALQASISNLSSISANIGTITAGTIDANNVNVTNLNADHINSGILGQPIQTTSTTTSFIKSGGGGGLKIGGSAGSIGTDGLQVFAFRVDNSGDGITTGYFSTSQGIYLNGHFLQNGNSNGQIKIDGTNKSAIVPYERGYRALYCIESPEVWFMDFCENKEELDPIFLGVTEGPFKFIKLDGMGYQVWRRRKGHRQYRFEEKTKSEFEKNERFLQMAK